MRILANGVTAAAIAIVGLALSGCEQRSQAGPTADHQAALDLRDKLLEGKKDEAEKTDEGAEEPTAKGWGTLRGTVTYVGTAPPPKPFDTTKDAYCTTHPVLDESLQVGPDGGLANVVLFLRTSKVPVHPDYDLKKPVLLDNKQCRFEPHVQGLVVGQPLDVKNSDPVGHNSNLSHGSQPKNEIIATGNTTRLVFEQEMPMPMPVTCNIHPWMSAWVVLRPNPYVAVSDKKGQFELKNLPAGKEIELQLWHERSRPLKGVETTGFKVDGKGRAKIKLEPDQVLEVTIKAPSGVFK